MVEDLPAAGAVRVGHDQHLAAQLVDLGPGDQAVVRGHGQAVRRIRHLDQRPQG
ncbi:hypothetical protein BJ973_002694 [Actinoplanes tereljensis]|uniref:hypothetical protein n=1 Tax=Paractinoplanes tereljensis TaxID=571912 RepID=UPI00339B002B